MKKLFVKQTLDEDANGLPPTSEINLCVNFLRLTFLEEETLDCLITRFSKLSRAVRLTAWVLPLRSKPHHQIEAETRCPIPDFVYVQYRAN